MKELNNELKLLHQVAKQSYTLWIYGMHDDIPIESQTSVYVRRMRHEEVYGVALASIGMIYPNWKLAKKLPSLNAAVAWGLGLYVEACDASN